LNLQTPKPPCCDSAAQRSELNNTLTEYPLITQVLSDLNLDKAWRHVKANKGCPGIDNMSIDDFEFFANEHWQGLKEKLIAGSYQPLPVKRVRIPKPDGGERLLGIPTVIDRLSALSSNRISRHVAMDTVRVKEQVKRCIM
jgi:RNA-directed DNA polymerase